LHARQQSLAMLDTETGEVLTRVKSPRLKSSVFFGFACFRRLPSQPTQRARKFA
jgi:hypothetical protein